MSGPAPFGRALARQARGRPLRLLLTLLQLALAAAVVTVALHVVQAVRGRDADQALFSVHAAAPGGQIVISHAAFTPATVRELLELSPDVEGAAVFSSLHYRPKVEAGDQVYMLSSVGQVDATYFDLLGMTLTSGTRFTLEEARFEHGLILLEESVANMLFKSSDAVGRDVTLLPFNPRSGRPTTYRVLGTYRYSGADAAASTGSLGRLPALLASPPTGGSSLVVQPKPGRAGAAKEQVLAAARQVHSGLLRQHDGLDFFVQEPNRPLRFFETIEPHLLLFSLFGITALILAGVGVFSVTVVEVSEQAHQIGIRRALGASRRKIASEHAASAGLQALVAGGIGVLSALALVPVLYANLGDTVVPGTGLTSQPGLALAAMLLVLMLSVGLSLVPALRAGRAPPAEVLRER